MVGRGHKGGVRGGRASLFLDHLVSLRGLSAAFPSAQPHSLIVNNAIISFSFKANRRQQQQRHRKATATGLRAMKGINKNVFFLWVGVLCC